ncbi:MAG: fructose-specific PTS transporter subunit EIIC [Corynebacterium sp.]|nr:fructose-specific PTS transporter subunit EIIC [Corynebacterium sp.]
MSEPVINVDLVRLDEDYGTDKHEVIRKLAEIAAAAGRASDAEVLANDALAREAKSPTGVPGGVAIPHCRSTAISTPTLTFARLSQKVDFGGPDGDADLVFLIGAPDGGGKEHMKILSKLARALVRKDFINTLREAKDPAEIVAQVEEVLNAAPKKKAASTGTVASSESKQSSKDAAPQAEVTHIVAITACPTGIAHTYMAADSLTQTAEERNDVELTVETQGSSNNTPVAQSIIDAADAVIFATDVGVRDRERFAGKPVVESGVKRAINEPGKMIDEAVAASKNPNAHTVSGAKQASSTQEKPSELGWGKRLQQAVMTGVSYMVPFVAAGGLLLALGFLFGGPDVANHFGHILEEYSLTNLPAETFGDTRSGFWLFFGAVLYATGKFAMDFVVAALSGYIAFALAGRPGIAPGFVGGAISVAIGAGFIGGLVTGLLAGVVAAWIGSWKVPRVVGSLMPVVIIPLCTTFVVGVSMYFLLGQPLSALMDGLQNWLESMSGSSAVLLGIILGLMMCFDLGGPVNKAAYLFATAGLSSGTDSAELIMAAVMAAGMVPPIALSVATLLRKSIFTPVEQENAKSSWLLGLSFVSEGAIPFAAADPLRVIPAMMLGGATTGAITMATNTGSTAPHGGIFVLFAIDPVWGFLLGLAAGIVVATLAVIALKTWWPNKALQAEAVKEPVGV